MFAKGKFGILESMQKNIFSKEKMNSELKIKILYLIIFAPTGVMSTLIGQYLNSIGFSGTEIGTITSLATASGILSQAFWGKQYTNSKDGRKVIGLICTAGALFAIGLSFIKGFYAFAIVYFLMYFFASCVTGLCDSMVLELDLDYGSIRLWGAIGFGAVILLGGTIGDVLGLNSIFYIYAIAFLISTLVLFTIKNPKLGLRETDKTSEPKEKVGYLQLLGDKKAVQLIICALFIYGTDMANNTYFSFLYRDGGGTLTGFGTIFFLMIIIEAPFMGIAPKLGKKIGHAKLLTITIIISVIRFGVFALGPSYIILIILFPLHGFIVGVIIVEYMNYIKESVNPKFLGLAIAAFYAIGSYGGAIICNLLGGIAMDYLGIQGAYGVFGVLNLISLILFVAFGLSNPKRSE